MSEYDEELGNLISWGSAKVHRHYSEFVEREDLEQEAWLWAQTNARSVERLLGGEQAANRRMAATLMKVMDRHARAAKAAASGYRDSDSYYYGNTVVAMVLTEFMMSPVLASREHEDRMPTTDPSHGNNWPVVVADVKGAWKRAALDPETKWILAARFSCALTHASIAEILGVSEATVARRITAGLSAITDQLNQTIDILHAGGCRFDAPERGELPEEEA